MLHLMRELLFFNLTKTLPNMLREKSTKCWKNAKLISKMYHQQFTLINATVHLFCRNVFLFLP